MKKEIELNITKNAITKAKELIKREKDSLGLRIQVETGGCSGMTYKVTHAVVINMQDEVIKRYGISFFIDPGAVLFIIGSTVDWKEDKFKSGFSFENPNETARCGCGESFSI